MRIQTVQTLDTEAILLKKALISPVSVDKIKVIFARVLERKKISRREGSSSYFMKTMHVLKTETFCKPSICQL